MKVNTKGKYSIFICQESERKYAKDNIKFEQAPSRIILMKKPDNGPMQYIASKN